MTFADACILAAAGKPIRREAWPAEKPSISDSSDYRWITMPDGQKYPVVNDVSERLATDWIEVTT